MRLSRPASVEEAVERLRAAPETTRVFAGGVEVGFALRNSGLVCEELVDLKRVPGLGGVSWRGDLIAIGPITRHHTISTDSLLHTYLPSLAAACSHVGSTRIRMQGTLGGNFGHGHQHTDPGTAAVALGGMIDVTGPGGSRHIDVEDFWLGPYTVARRANELITAIRLRPLGPGWATTHDRVEQLHRPPTAVVSAALKIDSGSGTVTDARIGVGGVPSHPTRLRFVEQMITGRAIDDLRTPLASLERELRILSPQADLLGGVEFKLALLAGLIRRALGKAVLGVRRDELVEVPLER
jgi:carbon-monoxide dehydrogenase medium subunit